MKDKLKIGIFCPSNPLVRRPRETDYKFLISKGIEVFEHPQVRIRNNYLAGTIQDRVDAIHSLLKDDSIDVLMAFWGGANTNQLLPYLDFELFEK
jgi:muramoyltetrapeptide carboxypeptidase LdcA involved in peptidoglycan recycling